MTAPLAYTKSDVIVDVAGVSMAYGDALIIRDITFQIHDLHRPDVKQGQVVGLLGRSGIGKTQLLRILAGLQAPTSGTILLGRERLPVRRGMVGYVGQHYPLFPHRTILDNLALAARQHGLARAAASDRARELMARFQLEGREGYYPAQLSGGQRQRAAIIQQLLCSEYFIVMDEPFSGLDPIMADEVCAIIAEVSQLDELHTLILVTHDLVAASTVCDTLHLLGRERDAAGQLKPGATLTACYDLIERGLAWQPGIATTPAFTVFVRELRAAFQAT